ncbi:MAG: hypothetical protein LBE56_05695 [Tannerella sp.]|jgi:hypothetical protein|nr:hypothetical protein [Tannerella sp.]
MERKLTMQKRLFEEIRKRFATVKLATEVSELLGIEENAAYRRISGKTVLSLDEATKLCSRFNLSMDFLAENVHDNLTFRYNPIEILNLDSYRTYIRQFTDTVSSLTQHSDGEIYYTAEDVPLFHFLRHRELMFFKIFVWFDAVSGMKIPFERFVDEIERKESLFEDFDRLADCYADTSSCEIWTGDTITHIFRLLEYFCDMGAFEKQETVRLLFSQMNDMMEKIREWTETGRKDGKGNFQLYISATNLENNYILLKNSAHTAVGIRLYTVKSILTENPAFCRETEKWIENMMKKSTLLSGASERERSQFFQRMKTAMDVCRERLTGKL